MLCCFKYGDPNISRHTDATLDIPLLKALAMMSKYILMSCTQNRLVEHPQASEINIHLDKWALDLIMSLSRALVRDRYTSNARCTSPRNT